MLTREQIINKFPLIVEEARFKKRNIKIFSSYFTISDLNTVGLILEKKHSKPIYCLLDSTTREILVTSENIRKKIQKESLSLSIL